MVHLWLLTPRNAMVQKQIHKLIFPKEMYKGRDLQILVRICYCYPSQLSNFKIQKTNVIFWRMKPPKLIEKLISLWTEKLAKMLNADDDEISMNRSKFFETTLSTIFHKCTVNSTKIIKQDYWRSKLIKSFSPVHHCFRPPSIVLHNQYSLQYPQRTLFLLHLLRESE
jgi:hypothetical protein